MSSLRLPPLTLETDKDRLARQASPADKSVAQFMFSHRRLLMRLCMRADTHNSGSVNVSSFRHSLLSLAIQQQQQQQQQQQRHSPRMA